MRSDQVSREVMKSIIYCRMHDMHNVHYLHNVRNAQNVPNGIGKHKKCHNDVIGKLRKMFMMM